MEPPRLLGSLRLSTGCCQDLTCVSRSRVCDSEPLAYGDGSPPCYGHGFELPNSLIPSPQGPPGCADPLADLRRARAGAPDLWLLQWDELRGNTGRKLEPRAQPPGGAPACAR